MLSKLDLKTLEKLDPLQRKNVLEDSGTQLTAMLRQSSNFDKFVEHTVPVLRNMGHNLRLFDINFDVDLERGGLLKCGAETGPCKNQRAVL